MPNTIKAKSIKAQTGYLVATPNGDGTLTVVHTGPGNSTMMTYGPNWISLDMNVGDIIVGPVKASSVIEIDGKEHWVIRADSVCAIITPAEAKPEGG